MSNYVIKILALAILLLGVPFVHASLDISPLKANLNNVQFGKEYTFFLTVINTDSNERGVEMRLAYTSEYLEPYVRFDPTFFKIDAHDSKNVKITLLLDENIPIGKHSLEAQPIADARELIDTFTLDFAIPGAETHSLALSQFDILATTTKEPVYINMTVDSQSNTIERISPKVLVRKDGNVVDITEYQTQYTILPDVSENILLFYDPIKLNEGVYSLELEIPYHESVINEKKELDLTQGMTGITSGDLRSTNYATGLKAVFLFLLLATVIAGGPRAFYTIRKKQLEARISTLSHKLTHHEHLFKTMMTDVAHFIETANITLRNYGEQYELK